MTSSEKTKFRTTKEWIEFRKNIIKERNESCELCGMKYKGKATRSLQIHHIKVNDYTNLNPDYFSCLCSTCHKFVEHFARKYYAKNKNILNESKWLTLIDRHLPDKPQK